MSLTKEVHLAGADEDFCVCCDYCGRIRERL
jgi:hypothetical protein